jgi:hypothetical protein
LIPAAEDGASERVGRQAAVKGRARCRMHGGAKGAGGPSGARNGNFKHGFWTTSMGIFADAPGTSNITKRCVRPFWPTRSAMLCSISARPKTRCTGNGQLERPNGGANLTIQIICDDKRLVCGIADNIVAKTINFSTSRFGRSNRKPCGARKLHGYYRQGGALGCFVHRRR